MFTGDDSAITASWSIKPEYSPKVLIKNWYEERLERTPLKYREYDTIYGSDYKEYPDHQPDLITRHRVAHRNRKGMPQNLLLGHHGDQYKRGFVTLYDEDFNRRPRTPSQQLPALRTFDTSTMEWWPERSDYPLMRNPLPSDKVRIMTNLENLKKEEKNDEKTGETTYRYSYNRFPYEGLVSERRTIPRHTSSASHRANNQHMKMRGRELYQVPEYFTGPTCTKALSARFAYNLA